MAIVKTSPAPEMTVGDYRKAAIRHMNTCAVLWRYVKLPPTTNLKNLPEEEVLMNIFYLTGYIAECAIKYRLLTDCHSLIDSHFESNWLALPGVKMKHHFSFSSTNRDKTWSEQAIQDLCASSATRSIPTYLQLLGGVVGASSTTSFEQDMQASWEPTIRYHYVSNGLPMPPNKTDIEAFFQATKSLLRNLAII